MGKFILKSGLIFLMLVCNSKAQIEEINSEVTIDSTYRFQGIIPPVEFQYNINEIFREPVIRNIPDEILFGNNPSTIWLRTEVSLSNNNYQFGSKEVNTHFTSSLYQQYLKDSEFDMVRYILGTVQAGAVGYMAYKHIKKYGFWK